MNRIRFLHIPRTAGATLRIIFLRQYREKPYFAFRGNAESDMQRWQDLSPQEREKIHLFLGHMSLFTGIAEVDDSTTFTLLREPVSRIKSLCQYVFEGNWLEYPVGSFDLDRFLKSGDHQLFNHQTRFLINSGHDSSLGLIKSMSPASARDLALENLFTKVARFGIQKYFDESLMLFSQFLNWRMPFYTSWHKKDSRRLLEFKQSHLDCIAELNSIDIEVYNAAEKKFIEILSSSNLDTAKLQRFRFLNPKVSPLLKLQARINKRLTGREW
jgi:hypothetical protein